MAKVTVGICPSCGKDRELAYIKIGAIQATMCPYCLKRYLEKCVIPILERSGDTSTDNILIGVD